MNPHNLPYVRETAQYDEQTLNEVAGGLRSEYQAAQDLYREFSELRNSVDVTAMTVLYTIPAVQGSIKSKTDRWEKALRSLKAGDFEGYYNECYDSEKKLEAFERVTESDIPQRVADLLNDGRVNDAHALLSGRDPDTGKAVMKTYLRVNKASYVLYLLGYDRKMCLDTRIYRSTKPAIESITWPQVVSHPETELDNPYRNATPRMGAKPVPVVSHSGDPSYDGDKTFFEDKLKWNVLEYDAITGELMSQLAQRAGIPWELVPQVAFNCSGPRTIHRELMETLAEL